MDSQTPIVKPFRANAHLLKLLGDELIGDDRLAVFELVKNAYDANATIVDVTLNLQEEKPNIIIWDHQGFGMTKDDILNKWMEIGTNSKRSKNKVRTPNLNRLPLGEKGVGRLAVHKLGSQLTINTRAEDDVEYEISIDWPSLINKAEYIEDTRVSITPLSKPKFFQDETGTRIEISDLNNTHWTRGDLRRLKRLLTSLISPFKTVSDFNVNLIVPGREKEIADLLEAKDILNKAMWTYDFILDECGRFSSSYQFNPPQTFKELASTECSEDNSRLQLLTNPTKEEELSRAEIVRESLLLNPEDLKDIGAISGTFYVYIKAPAVLNAVGSPQLIKDYLKEQSGIRVYRDGIRVFNYGEATDDWLGLNAGRINVPGQKIDSGMVIGGIDLNLESSPGLKEKTNREGFDDNDTYKRFRWIIASIVEDFHLKHRNDREVLSKYLKGDVNDASPATSRFAESIEDIRKAITKHGLEKEMTNKVNQIESDYQQMREVTLSSGIAGINLAVIFHEVERGVDDLSASIRQSDDYETLLKRAEHLAELLEGFAPLLRRNEQKTFNIKALTQKVTNLNQHRFKHHNITISCPINTDESDSFEVTAPFGLLQATLTNLIDNSIHWTNLKAEKEGNDYQPAIKIDSLPTWFKEGPALVVMDNGPGFSLSAEEAIQPFKTSRPGGMGVGLYYSDKVMETIGGSLLICNPQDLDLPDAYQGAAVVMIFNTDKK